MFFKHEDGNVELVYDQEDQSNLFGVAMRRRLDNHNVHKAQQKHGGNLKCVITNLHNDHHVRNYPPTLPTNPTKVEELFQKHLEQKSNESSHGHKALADHLEN